MLKIATIAGALTLALTTASFAQSAGQSGQANPDAAMARQGSPGTGTGAAATTEPRTGPGTTGSGMSNSGMGMNKSSDGMMNKSGPMTGPSGQTSK